MSRKTLVSRSKSTDSIEIFSLATPFECSRSATASAYSEIDCCDQHQIEIELRDGIDRAHWQTGTLTLAVILIDPTREFKAIEPPQRPDDVLAEGAGAIHDDLLAGLASPGNGIKPSDPSGDGTTAPDLTSTCA